MKVFALSDLHLSLAVAPVRGKGEILKPMDVFGTVWQNCYEKIYENWCGVVSEEDTVLVAGDISWGMTLDDCRHDFEFLASLPGQIVLVRGNHDYWWQSISNVRQAIPPNVRALQNDSLVVGGRALCGSRGWQVPGYTKWSGEDEKIYLRELLRMEMSLKDGLKHDLPMAVMMHFPPLLRVGDESGFIELFERYGVDICVYGHLHDASAKKSVEGVIGGINFFNTTADHINFTPLLIWED